MKIFKIHVPFTSNSTIKPLTEEQLKAVSKLKRGWEHAGLVFNISDLEIFRKYILKSDELKEDKPSRREN